jgi:nitrogenase molybdenum-iron protein NifN
VPFRLFERLCGLAANDDLISFLTAISGRPAPMKYRRQRGQLVDAMLDGHFHIGGRKLAIGAEPDLLYDVGGFLTEMGAQILAAVTTTQSPVLARVATDGVLIGDLEDLETLARERGCDLFVTHSHGRQGAARLKIPFFRIGIPKFDRLGGGHQLTVGYRGARDLIFDVSNLLMADHEENHRPTPESWRGGVGAPHAAAH